MTTRAMFVTQGLATYALAAGLGLAAEHAEVLIVLLDHLGRPLTSAQMCRLCDTHRPLRLNVFQERIRAIREVMGRDAIAGFKTAAERNQRGSAGGGYGPSDYALSPEGVEQCRAALLKAADHLRALIPESAPLRTPIKAAG